MIRPGLERISLLLKDVSLSWRAFHVAGTNGKGSICAYIAQMLQTAQLKSGRFTSPHLLDRWDCISIDNQPVEQALFKDVEARVKWKNEQHSINASEFELLTATAFEIFNEQKVQVGVIECGMGGRLDATNVLQNPLVTVISRIGLDHQAFLGDTVEKIAVEKAGIIKAGVPCIVDGQNESSILAVIKDIASANKAPFVTTPICTASESGTSQVSNASRPAKQSLLFDDNFKSELEANAASFSSTLHGTFPLLFQELNIRTSGMTNTQLRNMWCAYLAVIYAIPGLECMENFLQNLYEPASAQSRIQRAMGSLTEPTFRKVAIPGSKTLSEKTMTPSMTSAEVFFRTVAPEMRRAKLDGRNQMFNLTSFLGYKRRALCDGAHNRQALQELGKYVDRAYRFKTAKSSVTWLVAHSDGRNPDVFRECIHPNDKVIVVEFGPVDGMPWVKPLGTEVIAAALSKIGLQALEQHGTEIERGLRRACELATGGSLVITGSLYLISDVFRLVRKVRRAQGASKAAMRAAPVTGSACSHHSDE